LKKGKKEEKEEKKKKSRLTPMASANA